MKTKAYLSVLAFMLVIFCQTIFAIPAQEDFYHKVYKIEWKGASGKVLTQYSQLTGQVYINGWYWISPTLGEHVSLYNYYSGSDRQQWIIAPITPGGNEFYIINKATGNPLMIDGTSIRCNTSGITDDRQRFRFKNINGDYFQIQSASTAGHAYKKDNPVVDNAGRTMGYYYSLSYVSTTSSVTDDYSYFKLIEVGDIQGSGNVSAANLIYRPDLKLNIPVPPELTSYGADAPEFVNETVIGESWVPFCLVKDNTLFPAEKFAQTPFYKLVRAQAWEKVKDFSYEPGGAYTSTYKTYLGVSSTSTQTTQTYLEHSWTLTGSAEFISETLKRTLGASYSGKLSTTVTRVDQYSTNQITEKTITLNFDVPYRVRFVVYELVDKYYLKRMNGSDVISAADVPKIYYEDISHERKWASQPIIVTNNTTTNTKTISPAPPAAPTNLQVAIGSMTLLPELTWTASASSNISEYEIWGQEGAGGTWQFLKTSNVPAYTDGEIYGGQNVSYYYKVRAKSTTGLYSPFSSIISTSPASPENLTVSWSTTIQYPILSWWGGTESNIVYEIWAKDLSNTAWSFVKNSISTTFTDAEFWNGELTYYKVRAKNYIGTFSNFSNTVTFVESSYKKKADEITEVNFTPTSYALIQNYPNPFNPSTVIVYDIPEAARVTLKVYDMLGREVANLVDEYKEAGRYSAKFDASRLSTGIYIYKLTANEFQSVKKMNFVK